MNYYALCAVSGCVWAFVAWLIGHQWMEKMIWGGMLASPLIGLVVGRIYRPAYARSRKVQWVFAFLTLYVGATMFGLACGVYDLVHNVSDQQVAEQLYEATVATLWGLTFGGYFVILWPWAYLNHRLLGHIAKT